MARNWWKGPGCRERQKAGRLQRPLAWLAIASNHINAGPSDVQRHSDGANSAGNVPNARFASPRAIAVALEVLAQAQSMAPTDEATGVAPLTFGESTIVFPFKEVGNPFPAVAAITTSTGHGVTPPTI